LERVSAEDGGAPENGGAPEGAEGMGELEVQVIDLFVRGVRVLGLPKSVGEIYGMLYISPQPLALDALVGRLRMSKGSASQGLKFLRHLGAVSVVYVAGDRRDHYAAQMELKALVSGFMKGELQPHLESGAQRLGRLQALVAEDVSEHADLYRSRVQKLETWRARGSELLKLVEDLLT
jgi:DNA-binding transcriptional regulator GbsR (MarR family)